MKKLYVLLLLSIPTCIYSQNINIPDSIFKAELVAANPIDGYTATDIDGEYITIDTNGDGEIQESEALQVYELYLVQPSASLIGVKSFTNLRSLQCSYLALESLDVSGMVNLESLNCSDNYITSLNVSGCTALYTLQCDFNELNSLNLAGLSSINQILCGSNSITTLDLSGLTSLGFISAPLNGLQSINVTGCSNLSFLQVAFNSLTELDLSSCHPDEVDIQENYITHLNIKNGFDDSLGWIDFYNNPLEHLCADEVEVDAFITQLAFNDITGCAVNTYCSFTPGGTYYAIQGNNRFDADSDGCDLADPLFPNLKFVIAENAINSGTVIGNASGSYSVSVPEGNYTITPMLENPTYFNVSPASASFAFPAQFSPQEQHFCITPIGIHPDLEITLIPLDWAVPGFDVKYRIVCKNKGNQVQSGSVTLAFEDDILTMLTALPPTVQTGNTLNWSFNDLLPTQTYVMNVKFNLNAPTDTPSVNLGDQLTFTAAVSSPLTDETIADNTDTLSELVVGSFDPNDKTCLEGTVVSTSAVGNYVHYRIRFENTGTFPATNIVVRDNIDLSKFDISTLVPLEGSHPFVTRISEGNRVEFIFEGINLPFDDANNDGFLTFKIKTKNTLVAGNSFSNTAEIYFDFNLPVITDPAITLIQLLGTPDFNFADAFVLYPNPVKNTLNIEAKNDVAIKSMEVYNLLGQLMQTNVNPDVSGIDVSRLNTGNYFIKVVTDKGTATSKFIKE